MSTTTRAAPIGAADLAILPLHYPHRYTRDGRDRAAAVLEDERIAGCRATFHCYYRIGEKLYVDASWAGDAIHARARLIGMAREVYSPRRFATLEYLGALQTVPAKVKANP